MLHPTYFIGDKECILIIALNPNNALVKYKKIREILSNANYRSIDTFNPCIIAHVNADRFFESVGKIDAVLEKGDAVNIVSCTEKGLGVSTLSKRLNDDDEIRSISGKLWDIPWMK